MSSRIVSLEQQVQKTIKNHNMIPQNSQVVLGLSGGADSLCLLHILNNLQKPLNFKLKALHLNHCLRGLEADEDEAFVKKHCQDLGIPISLYHIDIATLAKERKLSTEDAGRKVRYELLKKESKGGLIALAHHKDDQAETVLMRILRGTGIHGLCAMPYVREDGIIRPLLDISKKQIEEYCKENSLYPRIDKSNFSESYMRNKIRLKLLPSLLEYNPNIEDCLIRLSQSAAEDDAYLQEEAENFIKKYKLFEEQGKIAFAAEEIRKLPLPIMKRVLSSSLFKIGLTEDLSAVHLKAMQTALLSKKGELTIQLPKGFTAYIHKKQLILGKDNI